MKCKAKVLLVQITDGKMYAKIQLNGKLPKVGTLIDVKWGATRSLAQNRLYFKLLHFLIEDAGLKDHGHFSVQGLHESLKEYFLAEKVYTKDEFKAIEEATTTTLNKVEFGEYLLNIGKFVLDFFEVDLSDFWKEYEESYGQYL